jgi:hypothetical protein
MLIILKDNDDTMLIILKIEICLTSNELLCVYKLEIKKNLKELFNNLLLFNNIQTQFNDGINENNRVYLNINDRIVNNGDILMRLDYKMDNWKPLKPFYLNTNLC